MESNDSSLTQSFCAVLTFKNMIICANSKTTISSESEQQTKINELYFIMNTLATLNRRKGSNEGGRKGKIHGTY